MKTNIFSYRDYKRFLLDLIKSSPNNGRGLRKKLAEFIGCQNTFITHVFSEKNELSLEQAEATARFFGLNREETEFFCCLFNTKELALKV
ncbi:MAG: hypothetical protein IT289_11575 [Oligoflexia bacterium]|nr:hypothetical protein [Oligoflexia bacterium]